MELTFTKTDNLFISEFKVDSDFNLHVERDELGKFIIWVKTTPVGNYAKVNHEENLDDLYVIDYNFTGTIYPKYIKIVSKVEPTYAAITTDGEVTEIKTQSKEIEITSNGTTNITPDAGFAYLNIVKVKTNVPTSGGGNDGGADYHYLQFISSFAKDYIQYSTECKIDSIKVIAMTPMAILEGEEAMSIISSAKFDFNAYSSYSSEGKVTVGHMVEDHIGIYFKEITEEEFYTL